MCPYSSIWLIKLENNPDHPPLILQLDLNVTNQVKPRAFIGFTKIRKMITQIYFKIKTVCQTIAENGQLLFAAIFRSRKATLFSLRSV
jgi:hypothetical protein